jgi:hypothetical protein
MLKFFLRILFNLLVILPAIAYTQDSHDSSVMAVDSVSVMADSSSSTVDSSESKDVSIKYSADDSLYKPIRDSLYLSRYFLRSVSQAKVNTYLSSRDYEYANDPEYWKKDKVDTGPTFFQLLVRNKIFQWSLFLLVIAGVMYGVYLLARENNFKWFGRQTRLPDANETGRNEHTNEDYNSAIRKYQDEGNYRLAVRYMFMRLIQSAKDRGLIQINDSATNTEIFHAFGQHPLATQFRYLARAYEYVFFGDFPINREIFESLKMKFDFFQEKISA